MKLKNILKIFLLLIITYQILINSNEVINSVKFSFDLWINNIFPSLFPFLIVSTLLINYGFIELSKIFVNPFMWLFGINSNISCVFIMSILSGFPSSSKYIKELKDMKIIDEKEANKAILFTHFSNPLFILGISSMLNKKASIIILVMHYITNIIIGIFLRRYNNSYTKEKIDIKKILKNIDSISDKSIGHILTNTIKDTISTLLLILGTITVSSVISKIICNILPLNNFLSALISGILEMSQGIKYISMLNISLKIKATIITMFLSFGGISIHLQVKSILEDMKYIPYLITRIFHAIISGLLVYVLFDCI